MCVSAPADKIFSATSIAMGVGGDGSQTPLEAPSAKLSSRRRGRSQRSPNRTFVEHKYHDHYNDPDPTLNGEAETSSTTHNGVVSPSRGASTTFPDKLHSMLANSEQEGYEDIVSWQPHGRCFAIHQKDNFVKEIMPRFFHQSKLTSFQRQLNLYGFIRLTAGKDRGAYYHEYFLRGRPDLTYFMTRTRVKGNGMKAASSPETEPDFYSMEPCVGSFKGKANQDQGIDGGNSVISYRATQKEDDLTKQSSTVEPTAELSIYGLHFPDLMKPRVISPPPLTSSSSIDLDMARLLDEAIANTNEQPKTPSTGDVVWFEGNQFRYLDHFDLDNFENLKSEPTSV